MADTLPVLFISHGSPTIVLEPENPALACWYKLASSLPRPKSILIMTAHWETASPTVASNPQPETIHDYYGFPESMYKFQYPAQGNPDFAEKIAAQMDLKIDQYRGMDHGTWVPLRSMYPDADIPVIQLSVCPTKGYQWHLEFGQRFLELPKQGVLIIGSGGISHNIRSLRWQEPDAVDTWTTEFLQDVDKNVMANDFDKLCNPESLVHGKLGIPTPDHYLPFLFAMGAGYQRPIQRFYDAIHYGTLGMQSYAIGLAD